MTERGLSDLREAFELMATIRRGIVTETALSDKGAQVAYDLELQGMMVEAGGLRTIVRHHRAKVVQMQALLAGLEMKYGRLDQSSG